MRGTFSSYSRKRRPPSPSVSFSSGHRLSQPTLRYLSSTASFPILPRASFPFFFLLDPFLLHLSPVPHSQTRMRSSSYVNHQTAPSCRISTMGCSKPAHLCTVTRGQCTPIRSTASETWKLNCGSIRPSPSGSNREEREVGRYFLMFDSTGCLFLTHETDGDRMG